MQLPLVVEIAGRDRLEVLSLDPFRMKVIGCTALVHKLQELRETSGVNPAKWALPSGSDHVSLLIQELILKLQGKWQHPYQHEEVCHCRNVSLETVEQAIINGAHTPEMVSRWTSASTACGTCRPDVEKILKYRLSNEV
ncbi:MAG: (2Fe-2S)-binding protein [Bdellovibrionales bacterium]